MPRSAANRVHALLMIPVPPMNRTRMLTLYQNGLTGRVEDGRGCSLVKPSRFPSPLIKPDVPISGIRLSDWLHRIRFSAFALAPDSRTGVTQRTAEPEDSQLAEDPLHRKLTGALRGHLVPPSQEMPYTLLNVFVEHLECFPRTP